MINNKPKVQFSKRNELWDHFFYGTSPEKFGHVCTYLLACPPPRPRTILPCCLPSPASSDHSLVRLQVRTMWWCPLEPPFYGASRGHSLDPPAQSTALLPLPPRVSRKTCGSRPLPDSSSLAISANAAATQYAQFALSITFFQLFLHVDAVVYLCHSHLTSITVLTAVWAQACGLESKTPLSLSCIFGHSHPRHFRFVCIRVRDISCLFVGEAIAVSLY